MQKQAFIFLAAFLLLSGCASQAPCKPLFIRSGDVCCLDENSDRICDSNQTVQFTLFDTMKNASRQAQCKASVQSLYVDSGNVLAYFSDNFGAYLGNQIVLDNFENASAWTVNGQQGALEPSAEHYGGNSSISFAVDSISNSIALEKQFDPPSDLSRWQKSGYITMWMKIEDPQGIDSASLQFEDASGNRRTYAPLPNVHSSSPNTLADDPAYPNILYAKEEKDSFEWTDFVLAPGWNYLFFRTDQFNDTGAVDLSRVSKMSLSFNLSSGHPQKLIFNDLRIQDGLQRSKNPTGGIWHPPLGRPQYGIYDIDVGRNGAELRLLNVRNSQYPSNGDHARMLTYANMPIDFALRTRFRFDSIGENLTNTYLRVTYDFEPDWDPGHDWFGAYLSLQYKKMGLMSVQPLKRKELQQQEPSIGSSEATSPFSPKENVSYQLDIVALGQNAFATIYELNGSDFIARASVNYTFSRPRYGADRRYPLAIESTGNVRTIIEAVEVVSLDSRFACEAVQNDSPSPSQQNMAPLGNVSLSSNAEGEGIPFEDFEGISGWSLTGAKGAYQEQDTTNVRSGRQSLRLFSTDGTNVSVTKTMAKDFSQTKNMLLWVYVPEPPKANDSSAAFELSFSSKTNFGSYYSVRISRSHLKKGWNKLVVAKNRFASVNGENWRNAMLRMRLNFFPSEKNSSISFDDMRTDYAGGRAGKAIVIMTFDDGRDSVIARAQPIMDANGQKGVAFIPTSLVGTPGYMALANLSYLYGSGWDISSHTVSHNDLSNLGKSNLDFELSQSSAMLEEWGFARSAHFLAYPMHYYDDKVINATRSHYLLARDGSSALEQPHFYSTDSDLPFALKAYTVGNYTTVNQAKAAIDWQIGQKGLLILTWHTLTDPGEADASSKYPATDFKAISDYLRLKQDQGLLDVITLSDYYSRFVKTNGSAQ